MPDDSAPLPAPGWYPHPAHLGSELFWDGSAWTERSRPSAPPAPVYGTPGSVAPDATANPYSSTSAERPAAGRNPMAVASLVLGILSILVNPLFVPSILAIVFGSRGRAAASVAGGGGLATAGLVTGIVGIVVGSLTFLLNLSGLSS